MKILKLLPILLLFSCAFGKVTHKEIIGIAIGRGRLHSTFLPESKGVIQKETYPQVIPPRELYEEVEDPEFKCNRRGYFNECTYVSTQRGEAYLEIAGGPPTTSLWAMLFDVALTVAAYFKWPF